MAQVVLTVNRRPFTVICGESEEARLVRLAQYVDAKVGEFVGAIGQVGDARLLLLSALAIADELQEARDRLAAPERRAGENAGVAARVAAGLEGLAGRIEALAAALETA